MSKNEDEKIKKNPVYSDNTAKELKTTHSPSIGFEEEGFNQNKGIVFGPSSRISIKNNKKPAMKVDELADEVASIIKRLDDSENNMIGVFGKWGRGKTFLMDEVWKNLEKENYWNLDLDIIRLFDIKEASSGFHYHPFFNNYFIKVDFQAWKYQDTPACWAYLFEIFSEKYLNIDVPDFPIISTLFKYMKIITQPSHRLNKKTQKS